LRSRRAGSHQGDLPRWGQRRWFRLPRCDLRAVGEAAVAERNTDPGEVAWSTAVEAVPGMLGSRDAEDEVPPEELYEKLEPFKRLVADDIRRRGDSERED
jgi:hypothetical protein